MGTLSQPTIGAYQQRIAALLSVNEELRADCKRRGAALAEALTTRDVLRRLVNRAVTLSIASSDTERQLFREEVYGAGERSF